jgi:hypothetical protein
VGETAAKTVTGTMQLSADAINVAIGKATLTLNQIGESFNRSYGDIEQGFQNWTEMQGAPFMR